MIAARRGTRNRTTHRPSQAITIQGCNWLSIVQTESGRLRVAVSKDFRLDCQ